VLLGEEDELDPGIVAAAAARAASRRGSGTSLPHVPQIAGGESSEITAGSTTIVSQPGQTAVGGRSYAYGTLIAGQK